MDASERLARVRQLLAGLPGPYGNEHLWASVWFADREVVFTSVFEFLSECAVIDGVSRFGDPPQAPQNEAELAPLLWQVDAADAVELLTGLASRTLAYHGEGRYPVDKAHDVFGRLRKLLGHDSRWWTNTTLSSWNPVTQHTFDALVVGMGGGVVVAVLAVDED
ncbi:hypothetical protein ABTX15_21605 [Micromonospora sp. NPDC094482]|uniref:hypothetical protein n=1 Tax=unclassified Micromonospora TaxID=2617518 RepID=UPI003331B0D5